MALETLASAGPTLRWREQAAIWRTGSETETTSPSPCSHLDDAVTRLIEANTEHYIPRGFLARAAHRRWLYATTRDPAHLAGAEQDLADAEEIARRDEPNGGAMRLYLTDIALERCRLCLAQLPPDLVAEPAEAGAPQDGAAASDGHGDNSARQDETADDWEDGIVDPRHVSTPAEAIPTEPPKPLRRWDMWTWLEQEKAREAAAPAEPEAPAPAADATSIASAPDAPALTPEHRALIARAEAHWQDAAQLIADTGYHRRDGERDALRRTLDRLAHLTTRHRAGRSRH